MTTPEIIHRAIDQDSPTVQAHLYQLNDGRYGVRFFDTEADAYFPSVRIFNRLDAATAYADAVRDPRIPTGWDVIDTSHE